jgi:NAD(P)-dependent dehydrogenase (short-subunit alcohol dehydrogenase family)
MSEPRTIVITGVSRGLGRALLDGFVGAGHIVIGCARSETAIRDLSNRYPRPHGFSVVDVAEDDEVQAWSQRVLASHGAPHLLVNNAALINENAELWRVPADQFSKVIDVNIKGVFYVIRHFLPAMIAAKKGVVVNFSSGWGRSTSPEVAPYCATKWAIEGLTQALARELPRGLAAVALNPGIINTQMLQSCFGPDASAYPTPDQWAGRAVPFLLGLGTRDNGQPLSLE